MDVNFRYKREAADQIERDVAQLLNCGERAFVARSELETRYAIWDSTQSEVAGSLHEKCAALIGALKERFDLDAEYWAHKDLVRFNRCGM